MSERRCVLFGKGGHRCRGNPQWHHPIKQQRIRNKFPRGAWRYRESDTWKPIGKIMPGDPGSVELRTQAKILRDPRNRIWACKDAHDLIEGDHSYLPASIWPFADEFGLVGMLENDIARQSG